MDLGIRGKKAIVCASSKGLGRGCAMALAEAGCDIVVNGRNAELLAKTAAEIREKFGVTVTEVAGDVSKPEVQQALLAACPDPDILVNNNGGPPFRDFRELDREKILQGVTNNMVTPIELVKAVIDGMAARGFGRIVNITSGAVKAPIGTLGLSNGARAGLTGFVAGIARAPKLASRNVTINNLLPGAFDTDRLRSNMAINGRKVGKTAEEMMEARRSQFPPRRFGTPEEFGAICAFLCSAHASYIVGQNILADGGTFPGTF
jgi:3-oxoacyl-[acyl-carrier protein] reductase